MGFLDQAYSLSSRAIIGEFYDRLNQGMNKSWVPRIAREIKSTQGFEVYRWLGASPAMREWIGGRQPRGLRDFGVTIENKVFESTLEISVDDLRRDKSDQIMTRIQEQADRANGHWTKLLSALIAAGETGLSYDGKAFFATDHQSGDSGAQSNLLTVDITTAAAPTASEMQTSILKATQAMLAFLDDEGEPMNEAALEFLVMVPPSYLSAAATALGATIIDQTGSTIQALGSLGGFVYRLAVNPRLTAWTTQFAVFCTDGAVTPLIRQSEQDVKLEALAEGSTEEFMHRRHLYGVTALRNVGFGYWQKAVLVKHA